MKAIWHRLDASLARLRLFRRLRTAEAQLAVIGFCNECGLLMHLGHKTVFQATTASGRTVVVCKFCAQRVAARAKGK